MTLAAAVVRRVPSWTIPLACVVIVALLPTGGLDAADQRQILLISILALSVSGLNLSLGFAGELALGQAATYAAGAYVAAYMGSHGVTDLLLQVMACSAAGLAVGVITGVPGLRIGSWSLAMASFFLVLLIPDLVQLLPNVTGGLVGLSGIKPATIFGVVLHAHGYYLAVVFITAAWLVAMRNLVSSRYGDAFRTMQKSHVLASSMGIPVFRMKVTAYAAGAVPAGIGGCLFANLDHFVSPESFTFALSITILAASILGGSASVYGAVFGAAIMQVGPLESTSFQHYALIMYGIFLIFGGVVFSSGIAGLLEIPRRRLARRFFPAAAAAGIETSSIESLPGVDLEAVSISKAFGGIHALSDVSLHAKKGSVTAIIGPNGSGKTTLLNVMSGHYRVDSGTVRAGGHELQNRPPHRVARDGIARTFQTPAIPDHISVADAVRVGRYGQDRTFLLAAILRLPNYRRIHRTDLRESVRALTSVGILDQSDANASSLPLGTRRLLELARAIAARPRTLLLDEVASGLDTDEVARLADLIRMIRTAGGTVILVEHNFSFVLSLADQIYVLAEGSILASGTAEEIEHNPDVLEKYLGLRPPEAATLIESLTADSADQ